MTDKPAPSTTDSGRLAASGDRATDAPHGAAEEASPPSGSVPTGAGAFTPAPWRVDNPVLPRDGWGAREGEDRCELTCLPHPTFDAIEIYARRQRDDYAEHEANARLIAAAPDLYEALLEAKGLADMAVMSDDQEGTPSEDQAALEKLRAKIGAALAKARGEQP
jgi:hypothetical protein